MAALVQETDDCIAWPYATREYGYGIIRWDGRSRRCYHVLWERAGRKRPRPPLEIRHLCGNSACVNLRHFAVGTHTENEADKIRHGTSNLGERSHLAKLDATKVRAIRAAPGTQSQIAARFGVSQPTVSAVINGHRWTHIQ